MNRELAERLELAWRQVRELASQEMCSLRLSAYMIAIDRVRIATELRGF